MTGYNHWPKDYFASRKCFIKLGNACGAHMASHLVSALGPAGEPLTVDVASLTSSTDKHLIILTSGVHGVEGFLGASIQIQALQSFLNDGLPEATGIVMIHAVNPWGFAHLRRVDNNNIDINRNFFDPSSTKPTSHPRYANLDPIINPRNVPSIAGEFSYWLNAIKLIINDRGITALFKPIAEGQYDFLQGIFFGGKKACESRCLLQKLILSYSANAERVSVLDIHSGLGRPAKASLIGNCNIVTQDKRLVWLRQHFNKPVYIDSDTSNAYAASGTFSQWCQSALSDKQFLYLCVEIGTVNPIKLFNALRRENQAHHWAGVNHESYFKTKQALLKVFAPNSERWRNRSVKQGLDVLRNALAITNR